MTQSIYEAAKSRAAVGMEVSAIAEQAPDRMAVYSEYGNLTFKALNDRVNQVALLMQNNGVQEGDAVALCCGNRPEFVIAALAAHRIGGRLTPVNWHLAADEISYIVKNCEAKAFFADIRVKDKVTSALKNNDNLAVSLAIGGSIEGFQNWDQALINQPTEDIANPARGTMMLYTSGTSGRPKGVLRKQPDPQMAADMQDLLTMVFQYQPDAGTDHSLVTGPLYHAGPFNLCMMTPLVAGISIVIMDRWEAEDSLKLIEQHKITHSFFVPAMFVRLLQLEDRTRKSYDVSTLRFVIHGAAPCSVETKQAMMDWFGPVIWEMFAGTEGPGTIVSPQDWLSKPGTVGKAAPGQIRILDDQGQDLPVGEAGRIFLKNPEESRFEYYQDKQKTQEAQYDGYFTAGDIGYLDDDGYLFLTGRSAEIIISGGVNIYPQEIDDIIALHPAVADVACVGVPSEEWGEAVKAVVELKSDVSSTEQLSNELIDFASARLARQKLPKSVDFIETLPRSEAGKVLRRKIRETYWEGIEKKI
ncbi:MAG: AMP-binding protein [Endozoicomonas sp.]|uniref:AMP-binding protein n=1 Tax=Endozoicomonas sp. TaxID=1892382 RepID=UPI003D9B0133